MSVAVGDFIQVIARQQMVLQQVLNVYHYRWIGAAASGITYLTDAANSFETAVRFNVLGAQNDSVVWTGLQVRNLTNGLDLLERAYEPPVAGSVTGDALPPFCTHTFRMNRSSLATRNGYKRFCGVDEDHNADGTSGLPAANITNISNALKNDISIAAVPSLRPVILKRPLPLLVPTSHPHSEVVSVDYRGIGSQNTRKVGRGI